MCGLGKRWLVSMTVAILAGGAMAESAPSAPKWRSAPLTEIPAVVEELREQAEEGRMQLRSLTMCMAERYAAESAAGAVEWDAWLDVLAAMGGRFPPTIRGRMCQDLIAARAATDEDIGKLSRAELLRVCRAMGVLRSGAAAGKIAAAWITTTKGHTAASPEELAALAGLAKRASEEGAGARGLLGEHIKQALLKDRASIRSADCAVWGRLATALGQDLSAEDGAIWASGLKSAFAGDPGAIVALEMDQLQALVRALGALGDEGSVDLVAARTLGASLETYDPEGIAWLAGHLGGTGDVRRAARARLAEHVSKKHLSDPAAARAFGVASWRGVVGGLLEDLSKEDRARWAGVIGQVCWSPAEGGAKVSGAELQGFLGLIERLSGKQGAAEASLRVAASPDALAALEPAALLRLASRLGTGGKKKNRAARSVKAALLERVSAKVLSDAGAILAVGGSNWADCMPTLKGGLTDETRSEWRGKLRSAFEGHLQDLSGSKDVEGFLAALKLLGDEETSELLADWMRGSEAWKSWPGAGLGWLAAGLVESGQAGRGAREGLLTHVARTYLPNETRVQFVPAATWRRLATGLDGELSAEARANWIAKLRSGFAGTPAVLRNKPMLSGLEAALAALGDKESKDVLLALAERPEYLRSWSSKDLAWLTETLSARPSTPTQGTPSRSPEARRVVLAVVAHPENWQSWRGGKLSWLAGELAGMGPAGKPGRGKIVQHVSDEYLSDPSATRRIVPQTWRSLVEGVTGDLSAEQRAAWADKLLASFAGDARAAASLSAGSSRCLCLALAALDSGQTGQPSATAVVARSDAWKTWGLDSLSGLVVLLSKSGEAGDAWRQTIVEHISAKHLVDAPAVRSVQPVAWRAVISKLGGSLQKERRDEWGRKIRDAYAAGTPALNTLAFSQVQALTDALAVLKTPERSTLIHAWASRPSALEQLSVKQLRWIAAQLPAKANEGPAAAVRKNVIAHVESSYFTAEALVEVIGDSSWGPMTGSLAGHLTADDRARWAAKLAAIPNEHPGTLAAMSPAGLAWLARNLGGDGEPLRSARRKLAEHVGSRYLSSGETAVSVACVQWRHLAKALGDELPPERRSQWLGALRAAYFGDFAGFEALTPATYRHLLAAMKALGDEQAGRSPAEYVMQHSGWKDWGAKKLVRLAKFLGGQGEQAAGARGQLTEHIGATCLASESAARSLSCEDWSLIVRQLGKDLSPETKADWSQRLFAAFTQDRKALSELTIDQVKLLAETVKSLGSPRAGALLVAWMSSRPARGGKVGSS